MNVLLGFSEVLTILLFSLGYGVSCIFLGWIPDISLKQWVFIALFFSLGVLGLSFGLWRFTSFKEGIHGWILVPGVILGKLWFIFGGEISFSFWLSGSLIVSGVFILLVIGEAARGWIFRERSQPTMNIS